MVKIMPKERAKKKNSGAIADLEAALGLDSLEDEAAPTSSEGEGIHEELAELHMDPLQDERPGNLKKRFDENAPDAHEHEDDDDDGDEETVGGETVFDSISSASRPVAAASKKRPLPQACRNSLGASGCFLHVCVSEVSKELSQFKSTRKVLARQLRNQRRLKRQESGCQSCQGFLSPVLTLSGNNRSRHK